MLAAVHHLKSPANANLSQLRRFCGDRDLRLQDFHHSECQGGVAVLVCAPERERIGKAVLMGTDLNGDFVGGPYVRSRAQHRGLLGGGDDRHVWFDDAGFLCRDFRERVAKPLLVVEADVGDDAGERRHDVGGVQPAAEAGFPDYQITFLRGEIAQGGTVTTSNIVGCWSLGNFPRAPEFGRQPRHLVGGDEFPSSPESARGMKPVWRSKQSNSRNPAAR